MELARSTDEKSPIHLTRSKKRTYVGRDECDRVDLDFRVDDRRRRTPFGDASHSNLNVVTSSSPAKRQKIPVKWIAQRDDDEENFSIGLHAAGLLADAQEQGQSSHVTPTKSRKPPEEEDPLTPTTNLKVLLSAISPALRDREAKRRKELVFDDQVEKERGFDDENKKAVEMTERIKRPEYSRKDKSLARLCSRFLDIFDKEENVGKKILLDSAAKQLGVERRRVYDIINVLESLEIAKREAKNQYLWKGRSQLPATVTKLKAHALQKGLMPKIDLQRSEEVSVEKIRANIHRLPDGRSGNVATGSDSEAEESGKESNIKETLLNLFERRDRSLGCLTQRFLMLFFVSDTRIVGLDVAALILIGNMSPESATWKTKVRRLYDIANILSSLDLIKKVRLPLRYGMKPAYQWVGTQLDTAAQQYVAAERLPTTSKTPARKRSYSKKHTLLDGFEAIPLPKSESADMLGGSQNSAHLSGSSQSESCLSTEAGDSTELQMASALMQLKSGQPILSTSTNFATSVAAASTQVGTTQMKSGDSTAANRRTILTVMQTSVLPSGQSLLVPLSNNCLHQAAGAPTIFLPTAAINYNNETQQKRELERQTTKPILLSFLSSSNQLQGRATVPTVPVFRADIPMKTSKPTIVPVFQTEIPVKTSNSTTKTSLQCVSDAIHTRTSTATVRQPFTVLPTATFSPASETVLPDNKHYRTSQTVANRSSSGPKPIAPKGSLPSNVVDVTAQLNAIRELLAQDSEAYETLIEKQRQTTDQENVLATTVTKVMSPSIVSPVSKSGTGTTFPVKALHILPLQGVSTARLSSPQQHIEHLHNEIKQQSGVPSPLVKPLHFHHYTPQKQSKESSQQHRFVPQMQCTDTQECAVAVTATDSLTCREQLSPATPKPVTPPVVGSRVENGLHTKRRQRTLFYPTDSMATTVEKIPVETLPVTNQISAPGLPTLFQHQIVSQSFCPMSAISASHSASLPPVVSLSTTRDATRLSDCKPTCTTTQIVNQDDLRAITDQNQNAFGLLGICPLWNFTQQRRL